MVRNTFKQNTLSGLAFIISAMLLAPAFIINNVSAVPYCEINAITGLKTCEDQGTFNVSVDEILTVRVNRPSSWAVGDVNTLLTNIVSLIVSTNNVSGFQASMTTATDYVENVNTGTDLVNTTDSSARIGTLAEPIAKSSFPVNRWGYSVLNAGASLQDATEFSPLVAKNADTPILVSSSTDAGTTSKDIYFGAKADSTAASGTYAETVLISVVTGVHDDSNPVTPSNPSTPENTGGGEEPGSNVAYNSNGGDGTATGNTVYTKRGDDYTYSEITSGNNTSNYNGYAYPQGVTETTASINEGTPLATGLAVTAAVAAVSGVFFFVAAKRRQEDDDDETYE